MPVASYAQEGIVQCSGIDCNFCDVVTMTNSIIEWVITLSVPFAILLLAYAGFKMLTSAGNPESLQQAKKILISSSIGIMLMLGAWTIVDSFLKVVAGGDLGVWNEIENCGGSHDVTPANNDVISLKPHEGINFNSINNFVSDHGNGAVSTGPGINIGSGGNCPGASAGDVSGIPNEPGKFLRKDAAANFIRMRKVAADDGITLKLSSAWRSQATQEEIWNRHNCDAVGCRGTVARPCSKGGGGSNHNGGVAVDISGSYRGSAIYNWLKENGGKYGFNNNLGPKDPVHWSPTGR